MRISSLEIQNFKGIKRLEMSDLGDVVVIAGPNGCGKSCILDAIRLLKSSYNGYLGQNEAHFFFNEFQFNMNNDEELRRLFADRSKPVVIAATFMFGKGEIDFLKEHALRLIHKMGGGSKFGKGFGALDQRSGTDVRIVTQSSGRYDEHVNAYAKEVFKTIDDPTHLAKLTISDDLRLATEPSAFLEFIFGQFDPAHLGIIEFHSANRHYQRERLGGINVNIEETANRMAQHALYNWTNKYTNIKSELAAAFIRDVLSEKAGAVGGASTPSILSTLKELFDHFLPGKTFTGPRPGYAGELSFPVLLPDGGSHDIDDLSSGEKELVYGYLRIRNSAPRNSIILLDEPELHLNPRLVMGLPDFYRKHIGVELRNQLWMTTHSDTFLRDAFKTKGLSIFHMSSAESVGRDESQVIAISAEREIDRAVIDLVGDIATFRPGSKIVIFESSADSGFDAMMTSRLFPEFASKINALSGDNKSGVRHLYAALEKAVDQIDFPVRVYAITDRDSDSGASPAATKLFNWDVYHIENYLLDETFIAKVMHDNPSYAEQMSKAVVTTALKKCAEESLDALLRHRMYLEINSNLMSCIRLDFGPKRLTRN